MHGDGGTNTHCFFPMLFPECLKDVIIVIDESSSMLQHQNDILDFLASLVGDLDVSLQGTHVSMATYSSTAHKQFDLNTHYNVQDLQNAIKQIRFRGGNDNLAYGLSYILQQVSQASLPSSADRQTIPDVVIFVTDHTAQSSLATIYGKTILMLVQQLYIEYTSNIVVFV